MAAGKAMRKSFYTEGEGVRTPDIAMPPLPEEPKENPTGGFGAVPEELPREVQEEMNNEVENVEEQVQEQPEQQEQELSEQEEVQEHDHQPEKKTAAKSPQDSFKAIREAKEKAEKENYLLMQQLLEYQKDQQAKSQQQTPEPAPIDDDIDFSIDEDGLVEGRYVKKVTNRIKNLEKQLQAYESQAKQQSVESRIKSQFPDFEKVVSEENIQMLNSQFPEIASSLRDTSDLYSKAVSTYNIMKRFGIHRDDPHAQERIQALRNTQKPKPLASVSPQQGDSPLSKANAFANGLTEDLKAQLRREMMAARRSA